MSPSRTSRSAVLTESVSLSLTGLRVLRVVLRVVRRRSWGLALAALLVLAAASGALRVGRAHGAGGGLGHRTGRGQYAGAGLHLGAVVRLGVDLLRLAGLARSAAAAARSLAVAR